VIDLTGKSDQIVKTNSKVLSSGQLGELKLHFDPFGDHVEGISTYGKGLPWHECGSGGAN
jgi:hypothetical protein